MDTWLWMLCVIICYYEYLGNRIKTLVALVCLGRPHNESKPLKISKKVAKRYWMLYFWFDYTFRRPTMRENSERHNSAKPVLSAKKWWRPCFEIAAELCSLIIGRWRAELGDSEKTALTMKQMSFCQDTSAHTTVCKKTVCAKINELQFELDDHPRHSPDMHSPVIFFLFFKLKFWLKKQNFSSK